VRPYTDLHRATFPVAVDAVDAFGRAFGLAAVPVSYLIDGVGIIRLRGGGPQPAFLEAVEHVLAEPLATVASPPRKVPPAQSQSIEALRARLQEQPDDRAASLELAQRLSQEGRREEAIACLEAVARRHPADGAVLFAWGLALLEAGHRDRALAQFKAARDLEPANWRIRKQIWAIEHPDKFYTGRSPDYDWQKQQLRLEQAQP